MLGEIRRIIGENIRKVCELKGIKQIDIAEYMGISQGSVSNWMKGINSIDIENLAKLCEFLGISLNQVYGVDHITAESLLSAQEAELLSLFRSLNKNGKSMIISTARAISGNPDMQKETVNAKMA